LGVEGRYVHVLLLEAVGKQPYIFGTNKLREAVGASHLVAEATTSWLEDAIRRCGLPDHQVSRVVLVSGKALCTVTGEDAEAEERACRALLRAVTTRVLRPVDAARVDRGREDAACGLQALGVWMRLPQGRTEIERDDVLELQRKLEMARTRGEQPGARLRRLPVVAACGTSDLPAAALLDDGSGDGVEVLSASSLTKRAVNWDRRSKLRNEVLAGFDLVVSGDLEKVLQREVSWLGVIHADGNQIGALFGDLPEDGYQARYRAVSQALEECMKAALRDAVAHLRDLVSLRGEEPERLPVVPLIASGDDLTVLIDGAYALPFAAEYLRAFERHTGAHHSLGKALTASAGVAIVKPHFPFSVAYQLCERAVSSAKALARRAKVSALDWHVHYDSVGRDLETQIRPGLTRGRHLLVRRPYAVLADDQALPPEAAGRDWRELVRLAAEVPVLRHPEPGEALPASQLYRLRKALIGPNGIEEAEALYGKLLKRPELEPLLKQLGEKLFVELPSLSGATNGNGDGNGNGDRDRDGDRSGDRGRDGDGTRPATLLLDFLDAAFVAPAAEATR
jgi:CRISPR RNA silencing complex Cmr2 subunit-like protein